MASAESLKFAVRAEANATNDTIYMTHIFVNPVGKPCFEYEKKTVQQLCKSSIWRNQYNRFEFGKLGFDSFFYL